MSQRPTVVYCLPGQGSDSRIFDLLEFGASYQKKVIEYGSLLKNQSLKELAVELSEKINTEYEFVLLGHSLGGILCIEIAEILNPELTIIISSVRNRDELPWLYRIHKKVPIYRLIPGSILLFFAKFLQPVFEPDRKKYKSIFKSMLSLKTAGYMKQAVHLLINWDRISSTRKIIHIHGDKDHTLPIRNIRNPDYVIKGGSHLMALTDADRVSEVIREVLHKMKRKNDLPNDLRSKP